VNSFLEEWQATSKSFAHVEIIRAAKQAQGGDFLFLISCQQVIQPAVRQLYRHALVIHASDLPRGRGMSPHVWQILEGHDRIVLTLLTATDPVDTGEIWQQTIVPIPRNAVFHEINRRVCEAEVQLMTWAIGNCDKHNPRPQEGVATQYRRRTPADSEIDPSKSLADVFDQLRIADPVRYPAFFHYRDRTFRISIDPLDS
jgi:methionyl-tRNA formyltransferase